MSVPQPNDSKPNAPNPYQPPQVAGEWAAPLEPLGRPPRVWAIVLGLIGGLSYLSFIIVLFKSSSSDRVAGLVFLCNLLLWLTFAIAETIRNHAVWRSYSVMAVVQFVIMGGMLGTGFGDPGAVTKINLIIIAFATILGGISLAITRSRKVR